MERRMKAPIQDIAHELFLVERSFAHARKPALLTFNFFSACVDFSRAKLIGHRRNEDSTQRRRYFTMKSMKDMKG